MKIIPSAKLIKSVSFCCQVVHTSTCLTSIIIISIIMFTLMTTHGHNNDDNHYKIAFFVTKNSAFLSLKNVFGVRKKTFLLLC